MQPGHPPRRARQTGDAAPLAETMRVFLAAPGAPPQEQRAERREAVGGDAVDRQEQGASHGVNLGPGAAMAKEDATSLAIGDKQARPGPYVSSDAFRRKGDDRKRKAIGVALSRRMAKFALAPPNSRW